MQNGIGLPKETCGKAHVMFYKAFGTAKGDVARLELSWENNPGHFVRQIRWPKKIRRDCQVRFGRRRQSQ